MTRAQRANAAYEKARKARTKAQFERNGGAWGAIVRFFWLVP